MDYLAACAIYLNEGPYLEEWIEFHRLVGVERFFLYNHMSTDEHRAVLRPYVEDGTVVVKDWPDEPGQPTAYLDCLEEHRGDARWIAFIDLDEFLFSPTLAPLPDVLADYEEWPGVIVNWACHGPSGYETRPEGLVIENYLLRAADDYFGNRMVKSIVDPKRAIRVGGGINPHAFDYTEGCAVDEQFRPRDNGPRGKTETVSFSRLRVNHYWMKSRQQWLAKLEIPSPQNGKRRRAKPPMFDRMAPVNSAVRDEVITAYVPELKAALAAGGASESLASG
jgi:hypothetical protein